MLKSVAPAAEHSSARSRDTDPIEGENSLRKVMALAVLPLSLLGATLGFSAPAQATAPKSVTKCSNEGGGYCLSLTAVKLGKERGCKKLLLTAQLTSNDDNRFDDGFYFDFSLKMDGAKKYTYIRTGDADQYGTRRTTARMCRSGTWRVAAAYEDWKILKVGNHLTGARY